MLALKTNLEVNLDSRLRQAETGIVVKAWQSIMVLEALKVHKFKNKYAKRSITKSRFWSKLVHKQDLPSGLRGILGKLHG